MLAGNWAQLAPTAIGRHRSLQLLPPGTQRCWRFLLLITALSLLLSASSAFQLTFEQSAPIENDESLPMYVPRSYPEFPSSYLLSLPAAATTTTQHHRRKRRHHGGRHAEAEEGHRQRRQFSFGSPTSGNVSLGHGDPGSGPWGPWSELSECTRSCGLGVQYQTRLCMEKLNPLACVGPSKRYFSCSYEDCSPSASDFRADQCSRFNSIPFEGEYHEWIPYTKVANPCELNCRPKGRKFYVRHSRKVIDGTRCQAADPGHICVEGVCVELGCDRSLGSGATEDRCRVCGGDGRTCRTVASVFAGSGGLVSGYNDILLVPAGATNIEIKETVPTNNYLAIRAAATASNGGGRFYLNGDWHIAQPQSLVFAGTKWEYSKRSTSADGRQAETLTAKGPTSEALLVVLLFQEENQGVSYEYSVPFTVQHSHTTGDSLPPVGRPSQHGPPPSPMPTQPGQYVWIFDHYSPCSRNCGTGVQRRKVLCATVNPTTGLQETAAEALCDVTTRPADSRPCFNPDKPTCPPAWFAGNWSTCSCVTRQQMRPVFCTSGSPTEAAELGGGSMGCPMLPDEHCSDEVAGARPASTKACQPKENCPVWIVGSWTQCDVGRCGEGLHNRTVRCGILPTKGGKQRKAKQLEVKSTGDDGQPAELQISMQRKREVAETEASILVVTTESAVVLSVDSGNTEATLLVETSPEKKVEAAVAKKAEEVEEKEEEVVYVDSWLCDPATKPKAVERCFKAPCDESGSVEWITSAWSSCDTDCGSAISTRKVLCSTRNGTIFGDEICLALRGVKPEEKKKCSERSCSKSIWFTGEWSACSAKCGKGVQTRPVFCGHLEEATGKVVPDEDESKCTAETKPLETGVCQGDSATASSEKGCPGHWLSGPLGPCTLPCGGGHRKRPLFCMHECPLSGELSAVTLDRCSTDLAPSKSEQCNIESCSSEDLIATMVACKDTPNGCCPLDNATPADEDYRNCPRVLGGTNDSSAADAAAPVTAAPIVPIANCKELPFGCCHGEQAMEAYGPFGLGCPLRCEHTRHGCCDDNVTVAEKADRSDCPVEVVITTTTTTTTTPAPPPPPTTTMAPIVANVVNVRANGNTEPPSKCIAEADVEGSGDSPSPDCIRSVTSIPVVDCKQSKFGCCQDGWTDATGPNGEGCDVDGSGDGGATGGGIVTTISSIVNGIINAVTGTDRTPSLWPDTDDCNLTEFGCCPNGKKKATGPRYYGCTCEDYPFGCCQDNFTPASGASYAGCQCDRMRYGCCPDGATPATGPDQDGCNCASSTHGCCSDMVTTARGPNFAGCPCDTLTFGCCPGSTVPAKGPNFGGCTCAETPFGCCADGVTVAYGPKFEGCPSGPQLDLKLASEVCSLPMTVGSCRNFTVKWYFDVGYGSCNRFWYGGCEGNGNRFSSQELCERACVKPEGPERCALPKISGPCNASVVAWHFDAASRRCERFIYGGCLGNTNRFETQQQCEEHCVYQEKALDLCDQPVSPGPCQGNYRRWYYRKEEGRCREFFYGGCQGNLNNFPSEAECSNACAQQTPFEICALPKAEGPCLGNFPRWSFEQPSGLCREFTYSGCEGNKNRFVDRESCERLCNQTITYTYEPNQRLPAPAPEPDDPNSIHSDRYESVCALPKSEGPCRAQIIQWWFNSVSGRCERFYYGGCDGNANRFNDQESCEHRCLAGAGRPRPTYTDPCLEPKDSGQCQDYSERWYFDVEDRRCHRFYFSGCGGNRNNYQTLDECSTRCERPRAGHPVAAASTETPPVEAFQVEWCFKNFDSGPCQNNKIRWYYDRRDGGCKEFIYGGCNGNENRFESQLECETKCWNSQDICKLSPARGSCSLNFTQWYFDDYSKECYEFQFSGCHGNANRFSSREECDQQCKSLRSRQRPPTVQQRPPTAASVPAIVSQPPQPVRPVPEHCRLPLDTGPCLAYIRSWYYSVEHGQCLTFVYGGCDGNRNRFSSRDACELACSSSGGASDGGEEQGPMPGDNREVVCRLPAESGPCQETRALWFYDAASHTCLPFAYGGCRGNKNRFPSYEHCIGFCGGVQSRDLTPTRSPPTNYYPPYQPAQPSQPSQPQPQPQPQPPPSPPSTPPEDCEPVSCVEEQCPLGIDYFTDPRGCYACRCTNPCYELHCPDDMSCALEMYRDDSGKPRGHAECRLRAKPGQCPAAEEVLAASTSGPHLNGTNCLMQCRTDADCRGADKCCNNGCADVCFSIFGAPEIPPYMQPQYQPTRPVQPSYPSYPPPPQPSQPHHPPPQPQPPSRPAEPEVDADGGFSYDPNSRPEEVPEEGDPYAESGPGHGYGDPNAIHVPTAPVVAAVLPGGEKVAEVTVTVDAGADALLNCELPGGGQQQLLGSSIIWSRDGRQVALDLGKYEKSSVNGSLIVRRTDFADHGTYACVGEIVKEGGSGEAGAAQQSETGYVKLQVRAPVQIRPGPTKVIALAGVSSYLQCNAVGFPDPKVTWWRGDRSLPLRSFKYEQLSNYTLVIRKVGGKDGGVYTCNAFNGIGQAALWDVTLLLDSRPVIETDGIVEYNRTYIGRGGGIGGSGGGQQAAVTHKPTSYLDRIGAEVTLTPPHYKIGSTLELKCLVRSQITGEVINPTLLSSVSWYANSDIPLAPTANARFRLVNGNSTLVLYHLMKQDSGEYRCRASTGPYTEAMASVAIMVDNIYVPNECQDSPSFTNCELIVSSNYCSNSFYNKFCCRSCYIAEVKAGRIREPAAAAAAAAAAA